jgi:hypothetical protein
MPRRTDISSLLIIGLGAILLPAATPAHADTTVTSIPVGRLTVVKEIYINTGISIPHVPERWKKIRLEWVSANRRVRFFLEDGGGELNANYKVSNELHPDGVCQGGGYPQAYQTRGRPERRWRAILSKQFDSLLATCGAWVDPARRRSYVAEFTSAAGDFGPGLELLKRAATDEFGGWRRRCLYYRTRGFGPDARSTCIRYSAKAN